VWIARRGFPTLYGFVLAARLFCHPFQNQSPIQPFGIAPGGLFDGLCAVIQIIRAAQPFERPTLPGQAAAHPYVDAETGKSLAF